jgi:anti-sigma regulatory factor (Ser/Thr protein kinase)
VALLSTIPAVYAAMLVVGALIGEGRSFLSTPDPHVVTEVSIALTVPAVCLLFFAAGGFMRAALRERTAAVAGMLSGSSILLATAWTYGLLVPGLTTSSVSGRDCLRGGAYVLILLVALRCYKQLHRVQIDEAASAERRRLARDLHDGMAQDLAFIAAHGERLAQDLGSEHPIAVAARRALAASRGAIADLSASDAPTTAAALWSVADELSRRHGVRITVEADGGDLDSSKREDVVRIAREAAVNAVQHGAAENVDISLKARGGQINLSVGDDGRGLEQAPAGDGHDGFGLRAMGERAEALGATVVAQQRPGGGTAVKVSTP